LIPSWAYIKVGGFSEQYFLHFEDADIVRKLSMYGYTKHVPLGRVTHGWARGSHTSPSQILSLMRSYLIYSIIWGPKFL